MFFNSFPIPVLFSVTTIACIIVQTINAYFAKKNTYGLKALVFRNMLFTLCMATVSLALGGFIIKISGYTLFISGLFGLVNTVYFITTLMAYKLGPYGYTSVIVSLSTVITGLSGYVFWGESFGVFKIVGITLMFFCFLFAFDNKKDSDKKASPKWFILSITSMVLSSTIGILQKCHQRSQYKAEFMGFLFSAFICSTLLYSLL